MKQDVEAVYENGVLHPLQPLHLKELSRVHISVSQEASDLLEQLIDHKLLEYARARTSALENVPTFDEIRARLSQVAGSMAEAIVSERGDY